MRDGAEVGAVPSPGGRPLGGEGGIVLLFFPVRKAHLPLNLRSQPRFGLMFT